VNMSIGIFGSVAQRRLIPPQIVRRATARPLPQGIHSASPLPGLATALSAALLCSSGGRDASAATSQTLRVAGNTIVVSSGLTDGAVPFWKCRDIGGSEPVRCIYWWTARA
jgi:hypothetical protein